jgi:uncharacterized RDD family membrane protein YckC
MNTSPRKLPFALVALVALAGAARAQVPDTDAPRAEVNAKAATNKGAVQLQMRIGSRTAANDRVSVGGSVVVKEGESARDVVVVCGNATIDGTVEGDLVVVLGTAKLGPTAEVKRDLVIVAGTLDADPAAKLGHDRVIIGAGGGGPKRLWLPSPGEWLTKGLLLARPLPHQFAWAWVLAGVALLLYVIVAVLFPKQIQASVDALAARPGGSFLAGLLAFLLIGPLFLLLAITVVGLLIVPFALCALVIACLFGKVAVYRFAGQQVGAQIGLAFLQKPLVALLVGALLFCLLYMVPVLGFLVWGAIAPLGLGAVVLAMLNRTKAAPNGVASGAAAAAVVPEGAAVPPLVAEPNLALLPRAGFWIRLAATLLDFLLVGLVCSVLLLVPKLFLLVWVVYHVGLWSWKGTTVGGLVFSLKIVRTDGAPMNFGVALVRSLASFFSFLVFGVGFFWAGWSAEKLSWHDKIAGTLIVKLPKGTRGV